MNDLAHYAALLEAEAQTLQALIPIVEDAQWHPAQAGKVEREVDIRGTHASPPDPVGDTVTDELRLALRDQVEQSLRLLKHAAITTRGVRRGLEIRLAAWEGPEVQTTLERDTQEAPSANV